jgi:transposase
VRFVFEAYVRGTMSRKEVQETLKVGKPRSFALAKECRRDAQGFSVS